MIEWPHQRENAKRLRERLLRVCDRYHVPVLFKARVVDDAAGAAYHDRIEIAETGTVLEQARTLVHELAHECLHYDGSGGRCDLSVEEEELEACAVERIVTGAYGVGREWNGKHVPARVRSCANFIFAEVEREVYDEVVTALHEFTEARTA